MAEALGRIACSHTAFVRIVSPLPHRPPPPQALHWTSRPIPMAATMVSWSDRATAEEREQWRRVAGAEGMERSCPSGRHYAPAVPSLSS
jgi:hypothetical protein